MSKARFELREKGKDSFKIFSVPRTTAGKCAEIEVFCHRQVRKYSSSLRHLHKTSTHSIDIMSVVKIVSIESHLTAPSGINATYGVIQCGLASTIAAQQCDNLPKTHIEIDASQNFRLAIAAA